MTCSDCGQPILMKRLLAVNTERCVECQAKVDRRIQANDARVQNVMAESEIEPGQVWPRQR